MHALAKVPSDKWNYPGRMPWYDLKGKPKEPYIIGLCGGTASGKTTVASSINERINLPWVVVVSLDSFYKILTPEQHEAALNSEYDFDCPEAIDFELAVKVIRDLKRGKRVEIPIYDFMTHSRLKDEKKVIYGADVVIVEGLMTFIPPDLCKLLDLKIFVDTDSDLRLCRRVKRDIQERGRDLPSILTQYKRFVKPNFDKYIKKLIDVADIVVPWNVHNYTAINMIVKLVQRNLVDRELLRAELVSRTSAYVDEKGDAQFKNFHLIDQTKHVIGLQTIVRDENTCRANFVLCTRRLLRLCVLEALSLFEKTSEPAVNGDGESLSTEKTMCCVFIMRSGEAFEDIIRDVLFSYTPGRILIQTNCNTGEPEFHHLSLPDNINDMNVLLMDATISTGAAAMMAIRILRDHDVNEEKIVLSSLISTPIGVTAVHEAFPKVRIVSTAMDRKVDNRYYIIPGIGRFRERYFGM